MSTTVYHEQSALLLGAIKEILSKKYQDVLTKKANNADSLEEAAAIVYNKIISDHQQWEEVDNLVTAGTWNEIFSSFNNYVIKFIDSEILAKPLTYLSYVQELYSGDEVEYDPMNKGDDYNSYSQLHQFGDDTLNIYVMQIAVYCYSHVRFIWSPGHEIENYLPKLIALPNTTEGRRYERRDGVLREILNVKYLFDLDNTEDSAELLELFKTLFKNDLLKC